MNQSPPSSPAPEITPQNKSSIPVWVWIVTSAVLLFLVAVFVFVALQFHLFGAEKPSRTTVGTTTQGSSDGKKTNDTCLTAEIVKQSTDATYAPSPYTPKGYQSGITLFFEADSADLYAEFDKAQSASTTQLADWMKQHETKKYHVEITPKVQETDLTEAGKQLAADRATKVKQLLIEKGAPSAKIVIKDPIATAGNTEETKSAYRNVNVAVIGDC